MKLPIIMALIAVGIIIYRRRRKLMVSQAETDTSRPPQSYLPTQIKSNDKLVLIKGASSTDIKRVLTDFCNMYNNENYQAILRLIKITEQEFAITFPYDIDFEIYCYFINYLKYPRGLKWSTDITGWTTTKNSDSWITEDTANKKAILFIPEDDKERDNVYLTTSDNVCYKFGFAAGSKKILLETPRKRFVQPQVDVSALVNKEFEDFK